MPEPLIYLIEQLDYTIPLGHPDNNLDVHHLIQKIKEVNWDEAPTANASRDLRLPRTSQSPGRSHPSAGDYIRFSPLAGEFFSRSEALEIRRPVRVRALLEAHLSTRPQVVYEDLDLVPLHPSYTPAAEIAAHKQERLSSEQALQPPKVSNDPSGEDEPPAVEPPVQESISMETTVPLSASTSIPLLLAAPSTVLSPHLRCVPPPKVGPSKVNTSTPVTSASREHSLEGQAARVQG